MKKQGRQEIVKPRQVAMYILRNDLNTPYPYIGRRLGQKTTLPPFMPIKK